VSRDAVPRPTDLPVPREAVPRPSDLPVSRDAAPRPRISPIQELDAAWVDARSERVPARHTAGLLWICRWRRISRRLWGAAAEPGLGRVACARIQVWPPPSGLSLDLGEPANTPPTRLRQDCPNHRRRYGSEGGRRCGQGRGGTTPRQFHRQRVSRSGAHGDAARAHRSARAQVVAAHAGQSTGAHAV